MTEAHDQASKEIEGVYRSLLGALQAYDIPLNVALGAVERLKIELTLQVAVKVGFFWVKPEPPKEATPA